MYTFIMLAYLGSIVGLCISFYIYRQKQYTKTLMCPREGGCEKVVHSVHAKTFGIRNEVLGILFYSTQLILWTLPVYTHIEIAGWYSALLLITVVLGVLFSLYLVLMQWLVIRAWCMWCLGSTFAIILITGALIGTPMPGLYEFLSSTKLVWIIVHNIGFIIGLGGATITDVFFFRFLKDGVITEREKEIMDTLSSVIWIGLAILMVSGLLLYLPDQARLLASSKFLLKVVVVSMIVLNGIALNIKVAPHIRMLSLLQDPISERFRRLAFALGAISITSWYVAFFLGSVQSIGVAFREGVAFYVSILITAIIGSQVYQYLISHKN